jgi:Peptidase C39 family
MSTAPIAIPYEAQSDPQTNRGCGAACLSMVYRSFGKEVPQAEIWPLIAKKNRFGSIASTTHLMALNAMSQGLSAVVVQARHPLQVLRLCREGGIRAILNQRAQPDVSTGHYTVLVDIDDTSVVMHDPAVGPSRRLSYAEMLRLWQPQSSTSEIAGNVLIGIAAEPVAIPACEFCRTAIPARVDCPRCKKAVGLNPAALLGCIRDGCIARMWNYVACPSCDFMWSFNEAGTSTADFPGAAEPAGSTLPEPQNLDKLFAELDRFSTHVLSIPGAANHPDLQAQLNALKTGKEKLKLAQIEELATYKARADTLAAAEKQSQQQEEAHRKKMEEHNAPPPPLDGNALGHALLKNLGFK